MNQAGALHIKYGGGQSAPALLSIESTRPQGVTRLLQNRTLEQAHQMVSLLFTVCRRAQAVAAARVAEQLQGYTVSAALEQRRDDLVCLELLHEHLWTLLIQLPNELGLPAATEIMTKASQTLRCAMGLIDRKGILSGICSNSVTSIPALAGSDLKDWAADMSEYLSGTGNGTTVAENLLAAIRPLDWRCDYRLSSIQALNGEELVARLIGDPSFGQQPRWQDQARETGALVRQRDLDVVAHGLHQGLCLQPRLLAILAEVQLLLGWLSDSGAQRFAVSPVELEAPMSRFAVTQLETARGGLIHVAELSPDRQKIQRYWIIAPTDWNFHPQGVLHTMAESLRDEDEDHARRRLALLVMMMNPCVSWEVQRHA